MLDSNNILTNINCKLIRCMRNPILIKIREQFTNLLFLLFKVPFFFGIITKTFLNFSYHYHLIALKESLKYSMYSCSLETGNILARIIVTFLPRLSNVF